MNRNELIAEMKAEYVAFEELLAQIDEKRMEKPGLAGSWSVKDVVAHLTAWRRRTVGRFEAVARGEPQPKPEWPRELKEDDEINEWFHARDRDLSVREVLSQSRQVFEQLVSAFGPLPQGAPAEPNRFFPWLEGATPSGASFFSHFHEEHEADLRAAASRQPTT